MNRSIITRALSLASSSSSSSSSGRLYSNCRTVHLNAITIHRQSLLVSQRQRRLLHNPMFPQRAEPIIPETINSAATAAKDTDFLSRHGGKVALVAISATIGLIYTYIESNNIRSRLEEKISHENAVDPLEINDLRAMNTINSSVFDSIVDQCFNRFPSGECTYYEFVAFVNDRLAVSGKKLQFGHVLERVVKSRFLQDICPPEAEESKAEIITDNIDDQTSEKISMLQFPTKPFPIGFLLATLNLAVNDFAQSRAESMFRIAVASNENQSNSEAKDIDNEHSTATAVPVCTLSQAKLVVKYLSDSYQVPAERKVIETGVKYPFRLYRRKTPTEMVELFAKESKSQFVQDKKMSVEDFRSLIFGGQVCTWGQCYRK